MASKPVRVDHVAPARTADSASPPRAGMVDFYARLRGDVDHILGVTLFPFYGTMLGAVREHDFISYDNDFDTAYISEHSEPDKVRQEFKDLCHQLLARGYDIEVTSTRTWVTVPGMSEKIDIFFAWFNADGTFNVSYGYHGPSLRRSADFFEFRQERLGEAEVPVPRNAEDILTQLYGSGWRAPDPDFEQDTPTRHHDDSYLLSTGDVTELHWSQFYRDHAPDRASRFAEFVADRFESPGAIVEFGCGSGRDGIYFATRGWATFSCDRSPEAIARADEVLRASGGLPARFETVDASSAGDIRGYLDSHAEALAGANPLVIYLRFFLHAIDEPAQDTLLDALTTALSRDFYLCAEFRTVADRDLAKHHGLHYRRYIDHEQLAVRLRARWGFEIEYVDAGQGLSPYDGEDPHLARIVASRPAVGD
jgi:hypothetical protein